MKIIFATHNPNKLKEVQALMPSGVDLIGLDEIGITEDIPETADTISGNAIQKVDYVKARTHLPVFADDTGLEVASLGGEPGIYSARYAGKQRDSQANMQKVLDGLEDKKDRSAQFVTVIALSLEGTQLIFEGVCRGEIIKEASGSDGFGYDPIFKPEGYDHTFAEMSLTQKSSISHRAKAMHKLIAYLQQGVNKH